MDLKELTIALCSEMSVSGRETVSSEKIRELIGGYFDEYHTDNIGNHFFVKRCGKAGAPMILIDTHFDEIGMLIKEITDGGFLRVTSVGGIDSAILQACRVRIYGKQIIDGVIVSTPPHLRKKGEEKELCDVEDILIDTGYDKDTLKTLVSLGDPVGFPPVYRELLSEQLVGKSFDNKACAAAAAYALADVRADDLAGDVCLLLSCFEETSRKGGGVSCAAFSLDPDYAMVIDVNLARVPDTKKYETVVMGNGVSISVSAVTDRRLTIMTEELCRQKNIKFQRIAAPASTGTNATSVNLVGRGIPVVDVGLPLKNMHTYSEVIDLRDSEEIVRLVREFVCSEKIAEVFR